MKELIGEDLFDQIATSDAICITTNCTLMDNGENPMGGGCAGAAARKWPEVPAIYGKLLSLAPNVPVIMGWVSKKDSETFVSVLDSTEGIQSNTHTALVAYPTMVDIGEPANLKLVRRSAKLLSELADLFYWKRVIVPRPGSGIGGLDWDSEVRPELKEILDNRFTLIHKEFSAPSRLKINATSTVKSTKELQELFDVSKYK